MKPTDEQISLLCARVCGYENKDGCWMTPDGKFKGFPPRFSEDRNALPELFDAVERAIDEDGFPDAVPEFEHIIAVAANSMVSCDILAFLRVPPRTVAVAALKALSVWPDSWETEEAE